MNQICEKKQIELNPGEMVTLDFYKIPNTKLAKAYRLFQMGMLEAGAVNLDKDSKELGVVLFKGLDTKFDELKEIFYSAIACSEKEIGFFHENEEKMLEILGLGVESNIILQGVMHYLGKSLKGSGGQGKKNQVER